MFDMWHHVYQLYSYCVLLISRMLKKSIILMIAAAEMFRRLKQERAQMLQETEQLQEQIKMFDAAIR
jgi:hypothetical protein